jgi:transcriptional regulator with XRE-family HTH domain
LIETSSRRIETVDAARPEPVNERIGAAVRALRARSGFSLEALADATGVSRSALSLIERAESSPTATVLDKIAAGLGVPLASLFGRTHDESTSPVARHAEQPVWRDPSSGYERRSVSPDGVQSPIKIVEVSFPPGARVAFESGSRERVVHQQLWVLNGTIEFVLGRDCHRLEAGDCLALTLDRPTMFHNPTDETARYAVVVVADPTRR